MRPRQRGPGAPSTRLFTKIGWKLFESPMIEWRVGAIRERQNDTVVVSVTSRGSPTATIRLLLLDG